jgi:hypothetical protein
MPQRVVITVNIIPGFQTTSTDVTQFVTPLENCKIELQKNLETNIPDAIIQAKTAIQNTQLGAVPCSSLQIKFEFHSELAENWATHIDQRIIWRMFTNPYIQIIAAQFDVAPGEISAEI